MGDNDAIKVIAGAYTINKVREIKQEIEESNRIAQRVADQQLEAIREQNRMIRQTKWEEDARRERAEQAEIARKKASGEIPYTQEELYDLLMEDYREKRRKEIHAERLLELEHQKATRQVQAGKEYVLLKPIVRKSNDGTFFIWVAILGLIVAAWLGLK